MDVLYDNLENYAEEATNAELREENESLKTKLEEYATTLEQLQKEFDTLLVEHKKLELNYSSLLRTAKAEIERKTQIITKLNIEKDELVLHSLQNRNAPPAKKIPSTNEPKKREAPVSRNTSQNNSNNRSKPSLQNQFENERREQNYNKPTTDFNIHQRNMHSRQQDIVSKSVVNTNITNITSRPNENDVHDNVKDEHRSRARIADRRKSLPVLGMDSKFSSDEDEVASGENSKGFLPKEPENRYLDRFHSDQPNIEHKVFVHHEYKTETRKYHTKHDHSKHRNRDNHEQYQKCNRNQSSDRWRRSQDRKKASPERRRFSPDRRRFSPDRRRFSPDRRRPSPEKKASADRNRKDFHDYNTEFYKRQEHDRHKRLHSPKEKYHDYKHRSRDSQHYSERHQQLELEKCKPHSQDRYATKHKVMHDYEEPSNKRMRVDSYPKLEEDRWAERPASATSEVENIYMSCQSPDQSHFETQTAHQTREIKLTASTSLEDPRLVSKKYALETYDGVPKLSTVDSANIDVKFIDASSWDKMKTVKVPDALITKPRIPDLPSASSLQQPMHSGASMSIQKHMFSDTTDIKQKSSVTQVSAHKTSSLSDSLNSNTPESVSKKSPKKPDNQKLLLTDSISIHESKTKATIVPGNLTQKLLCEDDAKPAAVQKKMSNDDLVKEIYMDIENPISNVTMESVCNGYDFDDVLHDSGEKTIEKNNQELLKKDEIEKPITDTSPKQSISKTMKKNITSSDASNSQKPIPKVKSKNTDSKTTDKTELKFNESKLPPKRRSSEFQNYITAKEMIAGDLELSDDNSDHTDAPIKKQNVTSKNKQETKDSIDNIKKDISKSFELTMDFDEASSKYVEKNDDTSLDLKKSKAKKKSLKVKEKESGENKESPTSTDKPVKKTEATLEQSENADTSLTMDQLVKMKESITKELAEKIIPLDKSMKKKDSKVKAAPKSKETAVVIDKKTKKKDMQPKELTEIKDIAPSTDKPGHVKKKDKKSKELPEKKDITPEDKLQKQKDHIKESAKTVSSISINNKCNIQESSSKKERETTNMEVDKKCKTKDNKFNELFGDSSSLVSPEDLGLVPAAVAPPENYIAMFEDAQDALDMESIRATVTKSKGSDNTEAKAQSFCLNSESNKTALPNEPAYQLQGHVHAVPVSNSTNENMYQNLQSGLSPQDNIVKTVIISSGIQPQCTLEATDAYPKNTDLHVMQCVKPTVLQDIALQALATSTPQKVWNQTVQAVESITQTRCESEGISETPVVTSASPNVEHSNTADEPDVTIFVKRRRKVLKKK